MFMRVPWRDQAWEDICVPGFAELYELQTIALLRVSIKKSHFECRGSGLVELRSTGPFDFALGRQPRRLSLHGLWWRER
jgi:hypothetical protein